MAVEAKEDHQQYNICGVAKERFVCVSTSRSKSNNFYVASVNVADCKDNIKTNTNYIFEFHVVEDIGGKKKIRDFDFDRDGPEIAFYVFNPTAGNGRYLRESEDKHVDGTHFVETCRNIDEALSFRFGAKYGCKEAGIFQFENGKIWFTKKNLQTRDSKYHIGTSQDEVDSRSRFLLIPVNPNKKLQKAVAAESERIIREKDAEIARIKIEAENENATTIASLQSRIKELDDAKEGLASLTAKLNTLEKEKIELLGKISSAHSSTFVQTSATTPSSSAVLSTAPVLSSSTIGQSPSALASHSNPSAGTTPSRHLSTPNAPPPVVSFPYSPPDTLTTGAVRGTAGTGVGTAQAQLRAQVHGTAKVLSTEEQTNIGGDDNSKTTTNCCTGNKCVIL